MTAGVAARPRRVVEPVDAEEVERMGRVGVDSREARGDRRRDRRGVPQFGESRQDDARLAETPERPLVGLAVDQMGFQPESRHASFPIRNLRRAAASGCAGWRRDACVAAEIRPTGKSS
jgi:hypothetical protein